MEKRGYKQKSEEEIVNSLLTDEELAGWFNLATTDITNENRADVAKAQNLVFALRDKDNLTQKKIVIIRKWALEFSQNLKMDIVHFQTWPDLFKYLESLVEQAKATQTVHQLPLK